MECQVREENLVPRQQCRHLDTEEVTGSIPVPPTMFSQVKGQFPDSGTGLCRSFVRGSSVGIAVVRWFPTWGGLARPLTRTPQNLTPRTRSALETIDCSRHV